MQAEMNSLKATALKATARSIMAVGVAALLTLGIAGCAPEPMAGSHVKGKAPSEENQSWSQIDDQDDPALKSKELPEGFPSDDFALPTGAVIDDAGQRGDRVWFVVLKPAGQDESEQWWDSIIETNGFTVRDEEPAPNGGKSATLANDVLTVTAMSVVDEDDGTIVLSYDITQEI